MKTSQFYIYRFSFNRYLFEYFIQYFNTYFNIMSTKIHNQLNCADMCGEPSRLIAIVLAAAVGIGITCSVFYPGIMSGDSLGMYHDAITGYFPGEGKPPMTAFLWMIVLKIIPSPFGPLLLQNVLFWGGLGIIVYSCRFGPIGSLVGVFAIGVFPTVFALLGILWHDVLMAAVLTLSVGLSLLYERTKSKLLLSAAFATFWCALCVRLNAFPAIVPLAVWLLALHFQITERNAVRVRTFIIVLIPLLLSMLLVSGMFSRLLKKGPGSAARSLQFSLYHDLAGMAVYSGDLRMPSHVHQSVPNLTLDMVRNVYDPADINILIYTNKQWDSEAFITSKKRHFQELVRVWAGAVAAHPGAYLHRRWDAIATILQIRGVFYPFHTGIDSNAMGLQFKGGPVYDRLIQWLHKTQGLFFRGWLFGSSAILIVIAGIRLRRWSAVAVCSSGLMYIVPYFVVSTGSDFRFIWWMIVSTLLGALLFFCGSVSPSDTGCTHSSCPTT